MQHDRNNEGDEGNVTSATTAAQPITRDEFADHALKRGSVIDLLPAIPRQTMNVPTIAAPSPSAEATPSQAPTTSPSSTPTE
jgi:hypothetical protein